VRECGYLVRQSGDRASYDPVVPLGISGGYSSDNHILKKDSEIPLFLTHLDLHHPTVAYLNTTGLIVRPFPALILT
jgi:hypothetical protein